MAGQPGRVVIVGAGPAGLALAYLLARRGVGVTVLETHHDFARAFRGEGLQRSGIDAFRQMGLGEPFDRLPHTAMKFVEVYSRGRRVVRPEPRCSQSRRSASRSKAACSMAWAIRSMISVRLSPTKALD